ncbi:MAG: hypothetical protein ABIV21_03820 [Pyrinomonadaceae bacterium]
MKFTLLVLVSLLGTIAAFSQQASPTPVLYSAKTIAELKRLQKAAIESNYAYRRVAYLSNNIGPRLTGSPQAARAVEYVADEMRKAGLIVRLQKLTVPHWVRGAESAELVQYEGMARGTTQKIAVAALGGSIATSPQGMTADVVVVNHFDELESIGKAKIAGKIVLFNFKFDRELQASGFGGAAYGQAVNYRFDGAVRAAHRLHRHRSRTQN